MKFTTLVIHYLQVIVPAFSHQVPQQNNEYDCGLFVLYFMERFIEEAPERLRKKDLAMVRQPQFIELFNFSVMFLQSFHLLTLCFIVWSQVVST